MSWRRCASRPLAATAKCLAAAAEAGAAKGAVDVAELARRHGVEPAILAAWLDYLGVGTSGGTAVKIDTPLLAKITTSSGYDFIKSLLIATAFDFIPKFPT